MVTTPRVGPPAPAAVAEALTEFDAGTAARGKAFHRALRPWTLGGRLVSLVALLVLALTPLGADLVRAVQPSGSSPWAVRLLLGTVAVCLVLRLVTLPTAVGAEVVLRRFGLSVQTWAAWTRDALRGWLLTTAVAAVGLLVLQVLVRRRPADWWLPAAVAAAAAVVLVSFLVPVLVEPLFNRFTPLPDGTLRRALLDLAARDRLAVGEILVADASRRTTALNAYVSGLGSTRRVVVHDTLLSAATDDEVRLVVAHELGHARDRDVAHGTAVGAIGAAAAVVVLWLALRWPWLLGRAGVTGAADVGAVALVLGVLAVVGALTGPLQSWVSRRVETRADLHALDLTGRPDVFAAMQRRLAAANLADLTPPSVVYGLFATHPSAPQRVALARAWAAGDAAVRRPRRGRDRRGERRP